MIAELRAVLARLAYLERLRASALGAFGPGETDARIRASVVAEHVAQELGKENSPSLRRDLSMALHASGWRSVMCDGVRLWKGMVPL